MGFGFQASGFEVLGVVGGYLVEFGVVRCFIIYDRNKGVG